MAQFLLKTSRHVTRKWTYGPWGLLCLSFLQAGLHLLAFLLVSKARVRGHDKPPSHAAILSDCQGHLNDYDTDLFPSG